MPGNHEVKTIPDPALHGVKASGVYNASEVLYHNLKAGRGDKGSIAAWLSLDHQKFTLVGVDINLSNVGTPEIGSTVCAETRPYLMNDRQQLWGIDMRDAAGNLLATSRISVMVMPARSSV